MGETTQKGSSAQNLKIEEAKDRFLEAYTEAKRAGWTIKNYGSILNRLARAFPTKAVGDLTADEIEDWLRSLKNVGSAARQQYKLRLRPFFKWLMGRGIISKNPMDGIIMPKVEQHKIAEDEWLTIDESDRLLAVCNLGEKATVLVGIKAGPRLETLTSPATQFDLEHHRLRTFEKRHREGILYFFNGKTTDVLKQYFENGQKWPYADEQTIGVMLARLARKAGITKKVTAKTLRHTFACHCRLKGMKLEDLRDLMGHESMQTTLIYANVGATEQQKAYERIWDTVSTYSSPPPTSV